MSDFDPFKEHRRQQEAPVEAMSYEERKAQWEAEQRAHAGKADGGAGRTRNLPGPTMNDLLREAAYPTRARRGHVA